MKYINSLNHYRALAIIFIMVIHCGVLSDINYNNYTSRFLFNLISGCTLNFSFISGFLFYIVIYKKYTFSTFIRDRIDRFAKPYVFLSIIPIIICIYTLPNHWGKITLFGFSDLHPIIENGISIFKYLVSGAHITAYWYIPFVLLMAFTSPLHIAFIKLNLKSQLIIFVGLLIIASIVHRPLMRTDVYQSIQSLIYFTPIYLLGIICAINKDKIYDLLKGKELYLLAIIIMFVMIQTNLGDFGLYKKELFVYKGIDTLVIKMVFVCLFFMVWLHRFEHVKSNVINTIANTSFAIYFLHIIVVHILLLIKNYFQFNFENYAYISFPLAILLVTMLSAFIALGVNRVFPKYSYILVGYGKKSLKSDEKN